MRDWSFGFPFPKTPGETSATADSAPADGTAADGTAADSTAADGTAADSTAADSETVTAPPVVVPYARFLERRAWREKIAADFHHADRTRIDVQAVRSEALSTEATPPGH